MCVGPLRPLTSLGGLSLATKAGKALTKKKADPVRPANSSSMF
jgi:hypothetical protein